MLSRQQAVAIGQHLLINQGRGRIGIVATERKGPEVLGAHDGGEVIPIELNEVALVSASGEAGADLFENGGAIAAS